MARAVVIGGGLAGLTGALLLREQGFETIVLEQHQSIAPLIRGFRRDGLTFETGFHYAGGLSEGGILHHYLTRLGLLAEDLETEDLANIGGETLRFPGGDDLLIPEHFEEYRQIFPTGSHIDGFFADSISVLQSSPYLDKKVENFDFAALYSQGESLAGKLAPLSLTPRQKCALGFRHLLYGVKPVEAAFKEFALLNTPYLNGIQRFHGGGEALAKAFASALAKAGAVVINKARVVKINTDEQNKVRSVEYVDGGGEKNEAECQTCLFTASPAALPSLLPADSLRPVLARRLASYRETSAPFMLFAAAKTDIFEGRQIFLLPDENMDSWLSSDKPVIYISGGHVENRRCPLSIISTLPESSTALWAESRFGHRPQAYLQFKHDYAEKLKKIILSRCPELNGELEISGAATDLTLKHYTMTPRGGIYGKLHSLNEAPILPLTRVGGLALAGQNIIMPGLMGAMVSAFVAVGSLIGPEKLRIF